MPRPTRLEYPGALYHVTARGVQQAPIFADDIDRQALIKYIARALHEGGARAFAYCLMGNHYHLVLQTSRPNLSALMQRINSGFCQSVNRRHERCGHLLEGRFKAIVVDRDNYLLEVCRYVDLNPVRAGLVAAPSQWRWSSHAAHVGTAAVPAWLATSDLHAALTGQAGDSDAAVRAGRRSYAEWVAAGIGVRLWDQSLRHGLYLGDDEFVRGLAAEKR
ncbi:MAG: REP-associated tyrosine transposase [Vitreoscilla sp.]|jgi:putative transposase